MNLDALHTRLMRNHPLQSLSWYQRGDQLVLEAIVVCREARGTGAGAAVLQQLCSFCDAEGLTLCLSPEPLDTPKHHKPSKADIEKLGAWYERFGLVWNRRDALDFSVSERMYRKPKHEHTRSVKV